MMTSDTSFGSTCARRNASTIATSPSLWAGRLPSPPLKAPTGVRAALAITMSVINKTPYKVNANLGSPIAIVKAAATPPGSRLIQPDRIEPDDVVNAEIVIRVMALHVIVPDVVDLFP